MCRSSITSCRLFAVPRCLADSFDFRHRGAREARLQLNESLQIKWRGWESFRENGKRKLLQFLEFNVFLWGETLPVLLANEFASATIH